jgi:hypothetical protein
MHGAILLFSCLSVEFLWMGLRGFSGAAETTVVFIANVHCGSALMTSRPMPDQPLIVMTSSERSMNRPTRQHVVMALNGSFEFSASEVVIGPVVEMCS